MIHFLRFRQILTQETVNCNHNMVCCDSC